MSFSLHLERIDALIAAGNKPAAVEQLEQLIGQLSDLGGQALRASPDDAAVLADAVEALTDLLRWDRKFDDCIALQWRLADLLPEQASGCRIAAGTLTIESGAVDAGLELLRAEADAMPKSSHNLLLGSTYAWLQRPQAAIRHYDNVAADAEASPSDQAAASYALFQLCGGQKQIGEAIQHWERAVSLDPALLDTLPEMVRMLIYWYDYAAALGYVERDPIEVRRSFYRTYIAGKTAPAFSRTEWNWIESYDPANLDAGVNEFSEAALRGVRPQRALDALLPFIQSHQLSRDRMVLTAIAWAQQREVERAKWGFDLALRLAERERPRRTRPGADDLRIFDAQTRIVYGEIPIDGDIRAHLDHYFMPVPSLH